MKRVNFVTKQQVKEFFEEELDSRPTDGFLFTRLMLPFDNGIFPDDDMILHNISRENLEELVHRNSGQVKILDSFYSDTARRINELIQEILNDQDENFDYSDEVFKRSSIKKMFNNIRKDPEYVKHLEKEKNKTNDELDRKIESLKKEFNYLGYEVTFKKKK